MPPDILNDYSLDLSSGKTTFKALIRALASSSVLRWEKLTRTLSNATSSQIPIASSILDAVVDLEEQADLAEI